MVLSPLVKSQHPNFLSLSALPDKGEFSWWCCPLWSSLNTPISFHSVLYLTKVSSADGVVPIWSSLNIPISFHWVQYLTKVSSAVSCSQSSKQCLHASLPVCLHAYSLCLSFCPSFPTCMFQCFHVLSFLGVGKRVAFCSCLLLLLVLSQYKFLWCVLPTWLSLAHSGVLPV